MQKHHLRDRGVEVLEVPVLHLGLLEELGGYLQMFHAVHPELPELFGLGIEVIGYGLGTGPIGLAFLKGLGVDLLPLPGFHCAVDARAYGYDGGPSDDDERYWHRYSLFLPLV